MGKRKSCTHEVRRVIINLVNENWSYSAIADHLNCSKRMVFNAIQHFKKNRTADNVPRKEKSRKTDAFTDRRIVRLSRQDQKKTAVDIHKEIFNGKEAKVSVRTIRRRLNDANLFGRVIQTKPLVSKKNRLRRLAFSKEHRQWTINQWKNVLFTDETKVNRFGSDGKMYVRRPPNTQFKP